MIGFYDLATQTIFGSFKEPNRDPYVYGWLNTRYARIWTSYEWAFRIVEPTLVTTLAGNRYLGAAGAAAVLPADFGAARQLFDDTGTVEIPFMEEAAFNANYLRGRVQGTRGKPEVFTVVNRKIILGPVPDAVYSFYLGYKRLLCHDDGAGNVIVGPMTVAAAVTDRPLWPPEHWEAIVVGARALGLKLVNDTAWFALEQQHDDLVLGMVSDDLLHDAAASASRQYGRDLV